VVVDLGIRGKRAAVAAGTAGLGYGSAAALVAEGVEVVVCGRDPQRLDAATRALGCRGVVADVSTVDGSIAFVREATALLGGIDILIANGGGPPAGNFASTPLEQYAPAVERSMLSVVAMCHEVVPQMRERGWGRIVAITSTSVREPIGNLILSNSARAGVTAFLKTLSREVAASGITVNTVQPGTHATDRIAQLYGSIPSGTELGIPTGTIGDPADFGRVVAFMCGDPAKFVTGTNLQVDGGAYGGLI
jgi:3-oxoacyl-[acyl-carrier protein] reductase